MTIREKLIEILKVPIFPHEQADTAEVVADYLLDNGVTVVVHGRWEDKPTGRYGQQQSWCSACGKHSGIGGIEKNRHRAYCPNCGARMDGDGNG